MENWIGALREFSRIIFSVELGIGPKEFWGWMGRGFIGRGGVGGGVFFGVLWDWVGDFCYKYFLS